jgi:hypothetical protein
MTSISWRDIANAISIYEAEGFEYVEVPWFVSDRASNTTNTTIPWKATRYDKDNVLVGSAEQSFIEMMLDGRLSKGKYVAASPCFRSDPPSRLHQATFFKVELIHILGPESSYQGPLLDHWILDMAETALSFFHTLEGGDEAEIVRTDEGFDIELHGIELGSYGYRFTGPLMEYRRFGSLSDTHGHGATHHWVYGTGLAEPRFSLASGK